MPLGLSFPECKMKHRVGTVTSKPFCSSVSLSFHRELSPPVAIIVIGSKPCWEWKEVNE